MPRKGIRCSRANCTANTLPSTPRSPKPPGMRMPSTDLNFRHAVKCSWRLRRRLELESPFFGFGDENIEILCTFSTTSSIDGGELSGDELLFSFLFSFLLSTSSRFELSIHTICSVRLQCSAAESSAFVTERYA